MDVRVLVTTAGPERPVPGTPAVVEIRDTSVLDVASTTVCSETTISRAPAALEQAPAALEQDGSAEGLPPRTDGTDQQVVVSVDLSVPDDVPDPTGLTVWARVAQDDHEHVAAGDWITVHACPVESETVVVEVIQV